MQPRGYISLMPCPAYVLLPTGVVHMSCLLPGSRYCLPVHSGHGFVKKPTFCGEPLIVDTCNFYCVCYGAREHLFHRFVIFR